jgi:hypothetical protein
MPPKKIAKIQARASRVFTEVLGDSVELRYRPDGVTVDVRYCARIGCDGCSTHTFGIGGLGHPDMATDLPREIYANVGRALLSSSTPRPIGFMRGER